MPIASLLKKQAFARRGKLSPSAYGRCGFPALCAGRGEWDIVRTAGPFRFTAQTLRHKKSARNRCFERYGEMRWRGSPLSADPSLRIKWRRFASQLEMERAIARAVARNATQRLARSDLLAAMYADARQITVDAHIRTVANDDVIQSVHIENGRYLAAIYGPRLRTRTPGEVNALVAELDATQAGHIVSAVVGRDGIRTRNRDGQTSAVGCEATAQGVVGR